MAGLLAGPWLVGWMAGWMAGWGWLAGWLDDWPAGWRPGCTHMSPWWILGPPSPSISIGLRTKTTNEFAGPKSRKKRKSKNRPFFAEQISGYLRALFRRSTEAVAGSCAGYLRALFQILKISLRAASGHFAGIIEKTRGANFRLLRTKRWQFQKNPL